MAFYLFRCPHCKYEFEVSKPMHLTHVKTRCPKCNAMAKRVFTPIDFKINFKEDRK